MIENLENKISHLKQDVNELREQYHKEKLTKDVVTQEKLVICELLFFFVHRTENFVFLSLS